jgi:hypothetical protein
MSSQVREYGIIDFDRPFNVDITVSNAYRPPGIKCNFHFNGIHLSKVSGI